LGVGTLVGLAVGRAVGLWVAVGVADGRGVGVSVGIGVGVGVSVGGGVSVGMGVTVGVLVGVAVGDGVRVEVAVTVAVKVGLGVRVGVEVMEAARCGPNSESVQATVTQTIRIKTNTVNRFLIMLLGWFRAIEAARKTLVTIIIAGLAGFGKKQHAQPLGLRPPSHGGCSGQSHPFPERSS
jgi:hypothetical protein